MLRELYPLNNSLGGPRNQSGRREEERKILPLPGLELRPLDRNSYTLRLEFDTTTAVCCLEHSGFRNYISKSDHMSNFYVLKLHSLSFQEEIIYLIK
jgi:hypothetical protein